MKKNSIIAVASLLLLGSIIILIVGIISHNDQLKKIAELDEKIVTTRNSLQHFTTQLDIYQKESQNQEEEIKKIEAKEAQITSQFNSLMSTLRDLTNKYDYAIKHLYDDFDYEYDDGPTPYEKAYNLLEKGQNVIKKIEKLEKDLTPQQATEFDKAKTKFQNLGDGILYG